MKRSVRISKERRAAWLAFKAAQKSLRHLAPRPPAVGSGYVARRWSTGKAY